MPRPGSGRPAAGRPGAAGAPLRVAQAGDGLRSQGGPEPAQGQAAADWPVITIDEAMAELDAMIGLDAVKDQVRSIAASVEAARRRALAGRDTEKPMQHFVFLGPPGTGKTAVARVIAKIFYAFGLLNTPQVVEAHRADLVGEYLGATAIKTNELVDSALGGVLFIDEAYSLVNEGDGQGDRFGNEAVQALLKRAEDNREDLIIILAGYERQMDAFLATNPGLNSRFGNRVKFPSYAPGRADRAGRPGRRGQGRAARPRRPPGAAADVRGGRPPPADRRAGQRPVRAQPADQGRPAPRRPDHGRRGRAVAVRPGHDPRHGPGARPTRS